MAREPTNDSYILVRTYHPFEIDTRDHSTNEEKEEEYTDWAENPSKPQLHEVELRS